MSNTQAPMTNLDTLRGTLQDIADLIQTIDHPHAMEKAIELCARAEGEATDALDEYKERNPITEAWACIVDTPFGVNDEATDEAMDRIPEKFSLSTWELDVLKAYPKVMKKIDQEVLRQALELEAQRIENSHVHATFAPALDLVRPPKGMSA